MFQDIARSRFATQLAAIQLPQQKRLWVLGGVVGAAVLMLLLAFRLVPAGAPSASASQGGAMICGFKFNDINGDHLWDGTLEPTLPGWMIHMDGTTFSQTVTDGNGHYCFSDLPNGSYFVFEQGQPPWMQTYPANGGPHQVVIKGGQSLFNVHFGNHLPSGVEGRKFWDQNNNGSHDSGEPGLGNWTIYLNGSGLVSSTVTDSDGRYDFRQLPAGVYTVTEQVPAGWVQTMPVSPTYYSFAYAQFQLIQNLNFGNYAAQLGQISGQKFHDLDGDGVKDGNEPGLPGWQVIVQGGNYYTSTVTDSQGQYAVMNLPPGNYSVYEVVQPPTWNGQFMVQWTQTYPVSGTYSIGLDPGEVVSGVDFGNWQSGKNDFCMIPWDNHFLNTTSLDTVVYIFNTSPTPQKAYTMTLQGQTTFQILAPLPIILNPLQYTAVPIRVFYPPMFNAASQATTFQATVTNLTPPATSFSCTAALWSYSPQWWTSPNVHSGLAGGIPVGFTQGVSFTVSNNSGGIVMEGSNTVSYTIMAMSRGMTDTIVSLNGLPPGTMVEGQLIIPPGGSADIPLTVEFVAYNFFAPTDIVFSLDFNGDGIVDSVTSHLVFLTPTALYLPAIVR